MIKFQDVTIADRETIQAYTIYGKRQNCDLSFSNIISWRFLYNTQWAIHNNFLLFRFYVGHHLAYMLPIPKPTQNNEGKLEKTIDNECTIDIINELKEDANALGHPFLMLGVSNDMVDLIEKNMPNMFDIKPDRDYADYIYTREKLVNLSGKKLHGKRNHINKFNSLYPNYQYKELTKELIPQCLELEKKWREKAIEEGENADLLNTELRSMTRVFEFWDNLNMLGGTLWVDNKLIAFTFGCPINSTTFDVCVEKADTQYEGAFTVINNEFAKHIPEQYYYINREEDLGEEGLRNAKLSYKPDILLEKNSVMEKHPISSFDNQERIKAETKKLWKEVFSEDKDAFVDLYFDNVYTSENNYTIQIKNTVVGALQAIDYKFKWHNEIVDSVYISGVCTKPNMRNLNIGNNIMHQTHFDCYNKGAVFAILIPAEEWLFNWYEKAGYAKKIRSIKPQENILSLTYKQFDSWQNQQNAIVINNEKQFEIAKKDIIIDGDQYDASAKEAQAMIRIINVYKALEAYANIYPNKKLVLHIKGDRDVTLNNAYYTIENGKVNKTHMPLEGATLMNVEQLANLLFEKEDAIMTLMLN